MPPRTIGKRKPSMPVGEVEALVAHLPLAGAAAEESSGSGVKAAVDWRRRVELSLQAPRPLHGRETPFHRFVEQGDDMVALLGRDGTFLYGSPALARFLGYGSAELEGERAAGLLHPEDQARAVEIFAHLDAQPDKPATVVLRYRHQDGGYRSLETAGIPMLDDPRVGAVLLSFRDITVRTQGKMTLESSEARFRTMLQGIEAGVVVHGADSRITAFNAKATELLGVTAAQMTGRAAFDPLWTRVRTDGSVLAEAELPFRRAYAGRQPVRDVVLGVKRPATGDLVWLTVSAIPVLTAQGEVAEVIVTFMDVTARIDAERAVQRQQTELRALFDLMPALIWFKDTENRILRVNQQVADSAGKSVEEIEGKLALEIYPDEAAKYYADDLDVIRSGAPKLGIVENLRDPDGKERWVQTDKMPVCDNDGKVTGIVVVSRDITERKRAEEELRDSEERFVGAFEHAPIGMALVAPDGRWLKVNRALCDLVGYTEAELLNLTFQDITHPEDLAADLECVHRIIAGEIHHYEMEKRYVHARGHLVTIMLNVSLIRDGEGQPRYFVVQIQDITERKQTEVALRESEERFRFLHELTEATRSLSDPEQIMAVTVRMLGRHLHASRCAYADVEKDGEQFAILHDFTDGCASTVGSYQLSLFGPRAVAMLHSGQILIIRNVEKELLPGEGADMFNAIGIKAIVCCPLLREGGLRTMMAVHQMTPREWTAGEVALVQDVVGRCWATIERRTAERNLRQSENRFKALFEQAAVGVAQADAVTGQFVQVNQRFSEIVGYTRQELESLTFAAISHPQDVAPSLEVARRIAAGEIREFSSEKRYVRKDRSEVWVSLTVSAMWAPGEKPDLFVAVAQDITERKRLEDNLRQTQKMEAMGTLAAGIAHDFNNILAAINGYTELARMTLTENPEVHEYLSAVLQASRRAADLVRQILTFSRQERVERQTIQLQPVVAESLKLLRASIPSTIEFDLSLAADAPTVLADATQVHQILMNLGTNAWHAMKDRPGRLRVTLEKYPVDKTYAATQTRLRPGLYARLSVSDTGCGMDQATLKRIFDPFFTTKGPGEGTGLGLAVVHGIMATHDGAVTVYSEPGEGTVFHLYFPAHGGKATAVVAERGAVPRGNGELILLVDDEDVLAGMGKKAIVALGYEAVVTTRAATALELVRADPKRFALVLTDQTMPGMTGAVLASQLRQIRADLPIILMTGYSMSLTPERLKEAGVCQLLLKPISLHALGTAMQAALSVGSAP